MKKIILLFLLFSLIPIYADTSRAEIVQALFKSVENWIGVPYEYGGTKKDGVDCSAFTAHVYDTVFNIKLPRSVSEQKNLGEVVKDKLQPGDLLFFNTTGVVSHVGIYVFDNKFIHAASAGPEIGVIKSSLDEDYYKKRFVFAKRLLELPPYKKDDIVDENIKKETQKKEISKSETPKVETTKAELVFAKILYRGKLIEETANFTNDKPVCFQIKLDKKQYKNLILDFENSTNKNSSKKFGFQVDEDIEYLSKIDLPKGFYKVRLYENNDILILEKTINVN